MAVSSARCRARASRPGTRAARRGVRDEEVVAGRERQGAWPEARPLGYPRPRADRGKRPATRRRRTHRPTLAPRRGRAAGGLAGRLRRRGRHLPGDRAAPAGQRLPPPRAAPRARAAPPSRAPREQVTGERAKTLTPRDLAWI